MRNLSYEDDFGMEVHLYADQCHFNQGNSEMACLATKGNTQLPGLSGIGEVNEVVPVFIADHSFLAHISSFFFAKTWVGH